MKFLKQISTIGKNIAPLMLLAMALIINVPANAQTEEPEEEAVKEFPYSEDELLAFFDINQEISVLQRETQQAIVETVENNDLTMERFNQIAQAAQIGALQGGIYSDEEINAFNETAPQVTSIQRGMQTSLLQLITDNGLTSDKYQSIMADYRADADLQAHVRDLLRERAKQEILEERRLKAEEEANKGEEK